MRALRPGDPQTHRRRQAAQRLLTQGARLVLEPPGQVYPLPERIFEQRVS